MRQWVQKAVEILRANTKASEEEVSLLLREAGVAEPVAAQLIVLVPLAYGHVGLAGCGVGFSDTSFIATSGASLVPRANLMSCHYGERQSLLRNKRSPAEPMGTHCWRWRVAAPKSTRSTMRFVVGASSKTWCAIRRGFCDQSLPSPCIRGRWQKRRARGGDFGDEHSQRIRFCAQVADQTVERGLPPQAL